MYRALRNLVTPFFERLNSVSLLYGNRIAHDFFFGDDKKKEQARDNVQKCGITEDQIMAEAMQLRAKELVVFDRMDNYRASAKRTLRKGFDRRAETRRNQSAPPGSQD